MRSKRWKLLILLLTGVLLLPVTLRAQELPTATPDAEGVIYVEVQPNDSLWSIAARAGITLAELLALNELAEDAVIQPGQRLIIGYGPPPVTPTSPPLPTVTLPPPTPRPTTIPPRTAICLTAYDDANQNGLFDPGEGLRAAVAFTLFDETTVVANYITDGEAEPYCVEGLSGGSYHVTRSIGPNEVLTNDGDWAVILASGDVAQLEFGSYIRAEATETAVATQAVVTVSAIGAATLPPPTSQPNTSATRSPRTSTALLAGGFVIMILFVAVLFLLIWKQIFTRAK